MKLLPTQKKKKGKKEKKEKGKKNNKQTNRNTRHSPTMAMYLNERKLSRKGAFIFKKIIIL